MDQIERAVANQFIGREAGEPFDRRRDVLDSAVGGQQRDRISTSLDDGPVAIARQMIISTAPSPRRPFGSLWNYCAVIT
jgi:hypothetical protein